MVSISYASKYKQNLIHKIGKALLKAALQDFLLVWG